MMIIIMVPECFTWIPHLLCSLLSSVASHFKAGFGPFPDDILVNILSRLSADDVKRCRIVCSHWRDLTSSTHFVELQSKRAPNVILVQCYESRCRKDEEPSFYVLDKIAKKLKRVNLKSGAFLWKDRPQLYMSFSGLLLLEDGSSLTVFNPVTQEERKIPQSTSRFAGIYFHPLAREYKILWLEVVSNSYQYNLYSPASRVSTKTASSPSPFHPVKGLCPAILNQALHYIVDHHSITVSGIDPCMHAVMVFQMESEHISTFPHPKITCDFGSIHRNMNLFVKDDEYLSLCHLSDIHGNIDIWILEDYANRFWVKQYKITLGSGLGVERYLKYKHCHEGGYEIKVMSIGKDELLIDWRKHGLFLSNVAKRSVKQIDVPGVDFRHSYSPVVYTSSLATPSLYS